MGLDMFFNKKTGTENTEAGYWRKANHIHQWFVDNVQGGEDECDEFEVTKEKMEELLKVCNEVVKDPSKGPKLLPTQAGFFFGGTEYDEWYMNDVEETIKVMRLALLNKDPETKFYYQSSW